MPCFRPAVLQATGTTADLLTKRRHFFREKVMSFEAVWGFDPEEALRAQNALRQGSVPRCDAWVEEVYIRPYDEVRIPQSENSQVYELRRLFRL